MIFKYGIIILITILLSFFNFNFCIYLNSGINTLNKFLYRSRISTYNKQNTINVCSLKDGPNCYYVENKNIKHYLKINNEIINEWANFFSKIPKEKYKESLINYGISYNNLYSNKIDIEQNPQKKLLNILMTFDDETTKKDMYLKELTSVFYNEKLIAHFEGQLRLSKDENIEKDVILKYGNYPSQLFGIIESKYISISFRDKLFICNYCYIKAHNEESKNEEISFIGSLSDKILYGYTYTDNKERKEKWLRVNFPEKIIIDKLIISGPYDIDNISFTFSYKINVDEKEIYYMYNHKKMDILIENENL